MAQYDPIIVKGFSLDINLLSELTFTDTDSCNFPDKISTLFQKRKKKLGLQLLIINQDPKKKSSHDCSVYFSFDYLHTIFEDDCDMNEIRDFIKEDDNDNDSDSDSDSSDDFEEKVNKMREKIISIIEKKFKIDSEDGILTKYNYHFTYCDSESGVMVENI